MDPRYNPRFFKKGNFARSRMSSLIFHLVCSIGERGTQRAVAVRKVELEPHGVDRCRVDSTRVLCPSLPHVFQIIGRERPRPPPA